MHTTNSPDRWTEIRAIWKSNQWLYVMAGFFMGLLCFPALQAIRTDFGELMQEFVPEAVGIVFTVLFIDRLYQRREEQRRIRDLKAQLVRDAGSQSNEAAKRAVDELEHRGWLTGEVGLLKEQDLSLARLQDSILWRANLQGTNLYRVNLNRAQLGGANLKDSNLLAAEVSKADLRLANLQGANLSAANMAGTNLSGANLQSARLQSANLHDAWLEFANLENADLLLAKLQNARLDGVNLQNARLRLAGMQGAYLSGANLRDADIEYAEFDENTRLPDNTYWTPETDLSRFTDPHHPDFWRSDNPNSPAYRGKGQEKTD